MTESGRTIDGAFAAEAVDKLNQLAFVWTFSFAQTSLTTVPLRALGLAAKQLPQTCWRAAVLRLAISFQLKPAQNLKRRARPADRNLNTRRSTLIGNWQASTARTLRPSNLHPRRYLTLTQAGSSAATPGTPIRTRELFAVTLKLLVMHTGLTGHRKALSRDKIRNVPSSASGCTSGRP